MFRRRWAAAKGGAVVPVLLHSHRHDDSVLPDHHHALSLEISRGWRSQVVNLSLQGSLFLPPLLCLTMSLSDEPASTLIGLSVCKRMLTDRGPHFHCDCVSHSRPPVASRKSSFFERKRGGQRVKGGAYRAHDSILGSNLRFGSVSLVLGRKECPLDLHLVATSQDLGCHNSRTNYKCLRPESQSFS